MAYASFSSLRYFLPSFANHPKIVVFTLAGMLLNLWRGKQWILKCYWVVAAILFTLARFAPLIIHSKMAPETTASTTTPLFGFHAAGNGLYNATCRDSTGESPNVLWPILAGILF